MERSVAFYRNVLGLAVRKDAHRRGIGRALVQAAEQWAGEQGIAALRVNSGMARTNAHAFYRAMGFSSEKDQKRFIKTL